MPWPKSKTLGRKEFLWLILPHCWTSLKEVRTGAKTGQDPEGKNWCKGYRRVLIASSGLFSLRSFRTQNHQPKDLVLLGLFSIQCKYLKSVLEQLTWWRCPGWVGMVANLIHIHTGLDYICWLCVFLHILKNVSLPKPLYKDFPETSPCSHLPTFKLKAQY